ncbi:hypothetical protein DFQ27_001030 [Actinomortierella ambigua]|uniref:Protein kinase domain-containing protein n=1 Tax=Actinomortierella ambigua TaxID=1343610 RepID=A0A9P6QBL7_9FUNG|nr:hypothetical protein DFQ27_001030 [Actinomortierella ambigua]
MTAHTLTRTPLNPPQASFVLGKKIGSGGFGSVYRAHRKGQPCAAKECFASYADLSNAAVKKEIAILQQLRHRYIIQYFESLEHDGHTYILMDLAEKGSLAGAIARGEVMDWPTKTRIAHEIARGLEYIHCRDILHRDLKTANVLLTRFMEVKLCDFGLAKVKTISASSSSAASTGGFKGTLRWAAPEALDVRPKYSKKSDVYALGMVMWAMAANYPEPFHDQQDNMVVAMLVRSGEREEIPKDTPAEYHSWIKTCWHQDPEQRPNASDIVLEDDIMIGSHFDTLSPSMSLDPSIFDSIRNRQAVCGLDGALDKLTIADGFEGKPNNEHNNNSSSSNINRDILRRSHGSKDGGKGDEVIGYLRKMASKGNADAQLVLGWMCDHGVAGSTEDAPLWYRKAAQQGHSTAQLRLGRMYEGHRGSSDPNHSNSEAAKWYRMAAERGEAQAQLRLGVFHFHGRGVVQDEAEAAHWFRQAAEQGVAKAQFNLGLMYSRGQGVEQSDVDGASWMRQAAEQDMVEAQFGLASMYTDGRGVEQSDERAATWYRRAAEEGHSAAQLHLGLMYTQGRGVEQRDTEAVVWLRRSADKENSEAQVQLGIMYETGRGLDQNYAEALAWYRRSAALANATAETRLGEAYNFGNGVDRDWAIAAWWYRRAADHGDAYGQQCLGMLYEHGRGVERSSQEAFTWYRRAADQGHAGAQKCIARMYVQSVRDRRDDAEAIAWRRQAIGQDDAVAQYYLGWLYFRGREVEQDYVEAMVWLRMAASHGDADAEFFLGRAYANGQGVAQSDVEAAGWYHKAATHGHSGAQGSIGWMHDLGKGVDQDDQLAFEWYTKRATRGDTSELFNLGSMFELGIGVKRDEKKALSLIRKNETWDPSARFHAEWLSSPDYRSPKNDSDAIILYLEGAAKGYVAAEHNLGRMYEKGRGVQKDRTQAMEWYGKAAEQGHRNSLQRLAFLTKF